MKFTTLRSNKKKKQTIEDMSVDELLSDLVRTDAPVETRPNEDPWSEEYLAKLHKIEARRTIEKHRRDMPLVFQTDDSESEPPVVSEKMSTMRKCQNCYYCTRTRKVGGSWWCHCANPGRSIECEVQTLSWVKSKLNLSCWKQTA